MTKTCENCKGEGLVIPSNGVDPKRTEPEVCIVCHGYGKVDEQPVEGRLFIRKYYGTMSG